MRGVHGEWSTRGVSTNIAASCQVRGIKDDTAMLSTRESNKLKIILPTLAKLAIDSGSASLP